MDHIVRQASPPSSHPLWRDGIDSLSLPSLTSDLDCDVAIIGGGFSGLWSAFHLLHFDPSLSIAVFEREEIGFGASGRNGGWVSADYPVGLATLARRYPKKDIQGFVQLLTNGVDEIGEISQKIAPRSQFRKAGSLSFATNELQMQRLRDSVDDGHELLTCHETQSKVVIPSAIGGLFTENCATVNPRGFLLDLARHLQGHGVMIFERSFVTHDQNGSRNKDGGLWVNDFRVNAHWKILATEAFTQKSREQIPLYSLMIATRSLSPKEQDVLQWTPGLAIAEATNNVNYAQFTADFRIALGGRGAKYPFAGHLDPGLESDTRIHRKLSEMIQTWFPQLGESDGHSSIDVTHHWGGPIAIRRNWESRICVDRRKGFARLGGYVGDGLTMSFVAARAVAEEIVTGKRPLADMPISSDCSKEKKWPVEPFRYIGSNTLISRVARLDESEEVGRQGLAGSLMKRMIGR